MEDKTTIVIDVQLNDTKVAEELEKNRQAVQYLTDQNKKLREEIKNGRDEDGKYAAQLAKNEQALKQVKAAGSALAGQVKQLNTDTKSYGSSMKEQAALLNALKDQYRSLTAEEREAGDVGGKLLHDIEALDAQVKQMEGSIGNFQRNVGGYAHVMENLRKSSKDVKDGLEGMGVAAGGFDKTMKMITTNPWMIAISLLVKIIMNLRDRLKDTTKVTDAFGRATGALAPIMETFGKWVGKIADLLVNVLDWAVEKAIAGIGALGRVLQRVGGWFGKDWGGGLIEYSEKMTVARQKTEEVTVAVEAADTAFKEYKTTVDETKEAVAEYTGLLDQLLSKFKEQEEEQKKLQQRAADLKRMYDAMGLTWNEAAESMQKLVDTTKQMNGATMPEMVELTDNATKSFADFMEKLSENAKAIEKTNSAMSSSFGSLSSIYQQMAKDESKSEAQRADAAKKAKTWAGLQIAANSGTALAKGIAGAMEAEPWPAKLAALATIMASVLSAVAQAKALAAQTYETGGVIGGYHGASMGHDNTAISARKGEMVLNANQQRQLFEIANGGATSSLTATLVSALQAMPAPVLDYKEFTDFTNRVASIDETAKLR